MQPGKCSSDKQTGLEVARFPDLPVAHSRLALWGFRADGTAECSKKKKNNKFRV